MSQLVLAARLAARGIRSYGRRSLQTLLVVGIGVALVVLVDAFMQGFSVKIMDQVLRTSGHLSITAPGYADQRELAPLDLFIPDCASVKSEVARTATAGGRSPVLTSTIIGPGLVSDGERSVTVSCLGIDPFWEGSVVPCLGEVSASVQGRFFEPGGGPGLLVSPRVADRLGARPGDRLLFLCTDRYGSFGVVELPLLGIVPRGATMGNEECLMDLGSMQSVTGLEGAATEVTLWLTESRAGGMALVNPREPSAALERSISAAHGRGLAAQRWSEISASYASMTGFMDLYMGILYAVFAVVAAVGMANSVLLSVQDRFRDLGALRIVALSRGGVSAMIAFESLLLGLAGAAAGALVGGAASAVFERAGFALGAELESVASYMANGITARFFPGRIALIAVAASLVPVLSSLLPISTLRRLTVREALGSV